MTVKADYARNFVWAGELTSSELERAAAGIVERNYAKGSYICHRDDKFDYWTGVVSGLIKLSTIGLTGKATTYAGVGRGGWFGEGSVLKGEARKYDIVALRDTRLAMMNRATFVWLHENSIGFNHYLLRQLNERLGQFIAMVEHDRILDAKARVARNLSWLFNPVLYPGTAQTIEITQDELALLAGVSRAVTNRSLQELQAEGLIVVEQGAVSVRDIATLTRYGD
ncbi:MAG: Crp/Fnr family transcriptional regulator [Notoacmeibacter sp.]|nr:Crp/Fnr family transcriptional regulator [Notoacmeibacter sp.]